MLRRPAIAVGLCLTLFLAAGPSSPGRAQDAPAAGATPGGGGGGGLVVILLAPAVQQELKLTDDQKTRVFEIARDASRRTREFFQAAIQAGGNNPQALMAAGMRLRQETERAADQILKPEQKDRAHQILYRVEGPLAVARPEVAGKLGLSRAQVQQVQLTMMQMIQAQRALLQTGGGADGSGPDAPARLRAAAGQQIGRALDAKQKNAFNKMLGEPFDIARIDPSFATPTAATGGDPPAGKAEKSRPRRKRAPAPKGSTPRDKDKDATEDARPKP